MPGREFLELARELLAWGTLPRHWRAVIIHAYYALLLECRDALTRWGLPSLPRQQLHYKVRERLVFATHPELKQIGYALDSLAADRNRANYDLRPAPAFTTPVRARNLFQTAADALALLDAIDADPARRAAAIASIPPCAATVAARFGRVHLGPGPSGSPLPRRPQRHVGRSLAGGGEGLGVRGDRRRSGNVSSRFIG
jgi:hypothetical protein